MVQWNWPVYDREHPAISPLKFAVDEFPCCAPEEIKSIQDLEILENSPEVKNMLYVTRPFGTNRDWRTLENQFKSNPGSIYSLNMEYDWPYSHLIPPPHLNYTRKDEKSPLKLGKSASIDRILYNDGAKIYSANDWYNSLKKFIMGNGWFDESILHNLLAFNRESKIVNLAEALNRFEIDFEEFENESGSESESEE